MAMIQVTSARLRSAAGELQNLNGQFQSRARELQGKEQALCQMWDGQAKDAFHGAFSRDSQQMDAFFRLINQYIQALLEIAKRYEQAEARNAQTAASRTY